MHSKIINLKKQYGKVESPNVADFNMENSAAMLYHENSKLDYYTARMLGYNIKRMDNEYVHQRASRPYKSYPGTTAISLDDCKPGPKTGQNALKKLVTSRRSARTFEEYKLTNKDLFDILHYSYGINKKVLINEQGDFWARRMIPSAGALYPLELYMLVLQGDTVPNGLYHYRPDMNSVELIRKGDLQEDISQVVVADPSIDVDIRSASAILIVTGVFERVMSKYLERGYRFMMIETGAVGQSVTLMCESIGLNSCYVGSFWDDSINDFMGLDGVSESVQAVIAIGKAIKTV